MMPPAPDPTQPNPATGSPPPAAPESHQLDRDEYFALMQDTTKLSDRRQSTNDLFVGLNVLFLTGMGFVFMSSHFTDWWASFITGAIMIFTVAFNLIWIGLIGQYSKLVNLRIRYLQAIEERMRATAGWDTVDVHLNDDSKIANRGVYTLEDKVLFGARRGFGFSRRERRLIVLFTIVYIAVFLLVCAVTYAVMSHLIPPFQPPLAPTPMPTPVPTAAG